MILDVCVIMYERRTRGLVPRPHRCHHGDPEMWLPGHWWLWLKKAAGLEGTYDEKLPEGSTRLWKKNIKKWLKQTTVSG